MGFCIDSISLLYFGGTCGVGDRKRATIVNSQVFMNKTRGFPLQEGEGHLEKKRLGIVLKLVQVLLLQCNCLVVRQRNKFRKLR